tara:strand:- start:553 stop:1317 length:765 start_codon:yes stop_codon:yes gene_type:complete
MNKLCVDDIKQLLDALLPFYNCIDEKTAKHSSLTKPCLYNIHHKLQKKQNKIKKLKKKLKKYKKLVKDTKKTNGIVLEINEKDEKNSIQNMLDVKFNDKENTKKHSIVISDDESEQNDDISYPDETVMPEHEETDEEDLQKSQLDLSAENIQENQDEEEAGEGPGDEVLDHDEEEEEEEEEEGEYEEKQDDEEKHDDEEEEADEEDEEEVFEYSIDNKVYYVTNKINSVVYELLEDGDVGDEIGKIINGQVKWD